MSRFEDRLWSELVELHGALVLEPAPLTRRRSRARRGFAPAAVLAAIVAVALAVTIALSSGGGTPAYAVTQNADGSVTVTIRQLVGVDGANGELATLGVPVRTAAPEPGCQTRAGDFTALRIAPSLRSMLFEYTGAAGQAVKIDPSAVPAGDTLLLAARESQTGVVLLSVSLYRGQAPPCLPVTPPGGP